MPLQQNELDSSIQLIAKDLREDEFFQKFTELLDFIVNEYKDDFKDVKFKYLDSTQLREQTIKEIIKELGFDYIQKLMDTLTNIEFNVLIDFVSLIGLLKGTRSGLQTVLSLIGLDTVIQEWWEDPSEQKEELTFDLTVFVTSSSVPDIDETIERVRIFVRHYVLPKLNVVEFRFVLGSFLERSIAIGGFAKYRTFGNIFAEI